MTRINRSELQLERQVVDQEWRPREFFLACEDLFIQYRLTNQTGTYEGRATATTDKPTVRSSQSSDDIAKPQLKVTMNDPEKEFIDWPPTYNIKVENVGDGPALDTMVPMETSANAERSTVTGQEVDVLPALKDGASRRFLVMFFAILEA